MKKTFFALTAALVIANPSSVLAADHYGKGASAGANNASYNAVSWGLGAAGAVVLGTVLGITIASAADTPSNFQESGSATSTTATTKLSSTH